MRPGELPLERPPPLDPMVRLGADLRLAPLEPELRLRLEPIDGDDGRDGREGCTVRLELREPDDMPPLERVIGALTLGVLRRVGDEVTLLVRVRVWLADDTAGREGALVTSVLLDELLEEVPRDRLGLVFATLDGVRAVDRLLVARLLVLVGMGRGLRTPGCPEIDV